MVATMKHSGVHIVVFCECILKICGSAQIEKMELIAAAVPTDDEPDQRIEDFFWTGSGDGPGPPEPGTPDPSPVVPVTVVRTTTVLATLYLDNSQPLQPVTDRTTGECILNCSPPAGLPDSLQPEEFSLPGDQRYWLLTVVRGGTPDALQLKLARLYQKAFLRSVDTQQERHLGIVKSLDAPTPRKKHEIHSFDVQHVRRDPPKKFHSDVQSSVVTNFHRVVPEETPDLNLTNSFRINFTSATLEPAYEGNVTEKEKVAQIVPTKVISMDHTWILATHDAALVKRHASDEGDMSDEEYSEKIIDIPLEREVNASGLFKREIIKPEQQPPVQVYIQNVTESPDTKNVEIVYVVTVGGRAVPAAVAARDMRLVRDAEVASELGYPVTTKAEPYLKAAEGLEGDSSAGIQGTELWAMVGGAAAAAILILLVIALLCRLGKSCRKKSVSSAMLHSYRSELLRAAAERNQLKQVHEEKDGRLISVVSPSGNRTRPSSSILPIYKADSSPSSSSSSAVSEVAAALRIRARRGHRSAQRSAMRPHRRVGTADSLLASAGISESSSVESIRAPSGNATPTSYLSMPSVKSFPRGNTVEPLNRVLEPVSVRHLDMDTPAQTPKHQPKPEPVAQVVPRRQMASQLVRLGSMDKDPGVVGPLVWDLHCQRIKEGPKPATRGKDTGNISRMRQRFNELVDDAFSLFGSPASSPSADDRTYTVQESGTLPARDKPTTVHIAQARNDNVRLPGSPYTAFDTVRGGSAIRPTTSAALMEQTTVEAGRPRTSLPKNTVDKRRVPPAEAWEKSNTQRLPPAPTVNPALILAHGHLPPSDPALPLISAIKSEIQRVREASTTRIHQSK